MASKVIKEFVEDLARAPHFKNTNNPWDYSKDSNHIRRTNLETYLTKLKKQRPTTILIGEAPGYRGCGLSGVPFTSERLIVENPFFDEKGFQVEDEMGTSAEASASIVWKTLDELSFYPLIWATFPYHPHKPGNITSNRAPNAQEMEFGKEYIERIMKIYKIKNIIAVGRVAEKTLGDMGIEAFPVRHPSHGGAPQFRQGLITFTKKVI